MPHHRYLIVGGGMAADAAVRGIRAVDPHGTVGLVSAEVDPPYDRPPLTKGLWKGMERDRVWRQTADLDVDLLLGRRVIRLDGEDRTATDDKGTVHHLGETAARHGRESQDTSGCSTAGHPLPHLA